MLRASTEAEFAAALPRWGVAIALTLNRAEGTHVGIIYPVSSTRYRGDHAYRVITHDYYS